MFAKKENILEFRSLGTQIVIRVVINEGSFSQLQKDFSEIRKIYEKTEDVFSRFRKDSCLSAMNGNIGYFSEVPPEFLEVVKKSLEWHRNTSGFFDPRIKKNLDKIGYDRSFESIRFETEDENLEYAEKTDDGLEKDLIIKKDKVKFSFQMDFSGIVKGWVCDKVAKFIKNRGYDQALIDNGGDIFALGRDISGRRWHIALEGFPEEKFMLKIENEAVATSGITRKKWKRGGKTVHHIINPKKPEFFPLNLQSVSVVAKSTEEADVWAKTLFISGIENGLKVCEERRIRAAFLDYRGNITISKEMKFFL
jgi:FAD:protein FMN transferase